MGLTRSEIVGDTLPGIQGNAIKEDAEMGEQLREMGPDVAENVFIRNGN
jgi:hypothetical protein